MKKIIVAVISLLVIVALLFQLSRSREYQVFGKLVSRVETTEKVVALTFDDGPTKHTGKIINLLGENKATFFLTGESIAQHPEAARQLIAAGHQIANHSCSHKRMVFLSYQTIEDEVEKTNQLIRSVGYEGEIVFRPPYGKKLFILPWYLQQQGITTITWDVEPEKDDAIANDSQAMAQYALDQVKPGSIILLHVMFDSRQASMDAVPLIIRGLKAKGYTFVTVDELLKM
ncbi:MAG: polysaccharide deacetylase family protein [Cellvibrio sp.]|uniref:polysaccharide deacetylase family protein n=1 Tax=Cellvibrio sp. TaxID=1965322 RepID=UPI0031AA242D